MDTRENKILAALLLAERRVSEDPWYHLATGGLTREQVANLRHRFETPEALARKLELFGPTTKETSEEILKMLLQRYFPSSGSDAEEPSAGGSSPSGSTGDDEEPSHSVVPLRGPSRRGKQRWWTSAASAGFALAAVVVLAWAVRPSKQGPLPRFEVMFDDVSMGDMRSAGEPTNPTAVECDARYFQDQSMIARLHPASKVGDELGLVVLARLTSGETEGRELWLEPPAEQSAQGVLTIDEPLRDLGLTPGSWSLTFYVTSEDLDHEELEPLEPGTHPEASVVRHTVCIDE